MAGNIYEEVNGKKPDYAQEGDIIVTGGGSYRVNADGTGQLIDKDTTTYNYRQNGGKYATDPVTPAAPDPNSDLMRTSWSSTPQTATDYYRRAYEQQNKAAAAQTSGLINQYQTQIPGINRSYDEMAKQAYINYMVGKKDLKEDLSSMGLGTQGVTESSLNQANSAYQGNLNKNELARQNALEGIQGMIGQAQAQGAYTLANNQAAYNQQLASIYAQQEQQKLAQSQNEAEIARQNAYNLIASGYYDEATAIAAGLTPAQGQYLSNLARQQKSVRSSGGGGSVSAAKPTLTYSQAKDLYESSYGKSKAALDALKYYNVDPSDIGTWEDSATSEAGQGTISAEKAEMLDRWFSSLNNSGEFENRVAQAIAAGQITAEELQAWSNS